MKLNRQINKNNDVNPSCIKDINLNCVNVFDTVINNKKNKINGFVLVTKFKRNFR